MEETKVDLGQLFEELTNEAVIHAGVMDQIYLAGDESTPALIKSGNEVSHIIDRTGVMLAEAKYILDHMQGIALDSVAKGTPPTVLKMLVETQVASEQKLVNTIERIHRSAEKKLEWFRTQVALRRAMIEKRIDE